MYLKVPLKTLGLTLLGSAVVSASKVNVGSKPEQTITSFGASGAWWPNDIILFPTEVLTRLGQMLFSEDGLYLSSYRYNMGGDGGSDPIVVTTWESTVESFLTTNGTYDFSRDHAGVTFLQMAQSYKVPRITFFINAAPSHIADNHAACGWNMTTAKIKPFADYITTVLSYWSSHGIDISYISPMNEPDNNRSNCGQEGMAVVPEIRANVFSAIKSSLSKSEAAKNVEIIGDETSQITTQAYPEYPIWLPAAAPDLSNIAVHNYDYPSDASLVQYNALVHNLTDGHPPPVKFTETCCSTNSGTGSGVFGAQYDPTMANALIVSRYVWQFLTLVNAVSFDWWTAVTYLPCSPSVDSTCATAINETAGYNSGLFYIDPNYNQTKDYTLYLTKRAFAVKHFSYFHRPGAVRHAVPTSPQLPIGVETFATKTSNGHGASWNILFMNNQTSSQKIDLALPQGCTHLLDITETTPEVDWASVSPLPAVNKKKEELSFNIPAQSMWTLQFVE